MVDINLKFDGIHSLEKELNDIKSRAYKNLRGAIIASAYKVESTSKDSIQDGNKTGKVYQKYSPRREHRASARGESPASDTGRLANSIQVKEHSGLSASIVSNAKYSAHLENDLERPFMEPAYDKNSDWIFRRIDKAIEESL